VQLALLAANPGIDVVYPNATFFGEDRGVRTTFMDLFPSREEVTVRSLVLRRCFVFVSATCRRDAVVRAGGFDENIRGAEDFDLWVSMAENGSRFLGHSRPLVRYRFRSDSLSSDSPKLLNTVLGVYKKHLARPGLRPSDRKALAKAIRTTQAELDLYFANQALLETSTSLARGPLAGATRVLHRAKLKTTLWTLRLGPNLRARYVWWRRNR
jgi:hypothetical protein